MQGARGLKMHQRSCQVIHDLKDELCKDLEEQITADNLENTSENDHRGNISDFVNDECYPELRKGINLPKSESEWSQAHEYFKSALQINNPCRGH